MSESLQTKEPLEDRAANWLNGVMWYGLASLATATGLWTLAGSFWNLASVVDSFSFERVQPFDSYRALAGLAVASSGIGALLRTWREKPARSP